MRKTELELFTSEELIEELVNRSTFQGVIIRSEDNCKNPDFKSRHFRITYNDNLSDASLCGILYAVANIVERGLGEEPDEYIDDDDTL